MVGAGDKGGLKGCELGRLGQRLAEIAQRKRRERGGGGRRGEPKTWGKGKLGGKIGAQEPIPHGLSATAGGTRPGGRHAGNEYS